MHGAVAGVAYLDDRTSVPILPGCVDRIVGSEILSSYLSSQLFIVGQSVIMLGQPQVIFMSHRMSMIPFALLAARLPAVLSPTGKVIPLDTTTLLYSLPPASDQ